MYLILQLQHGSIKATSNGIKMQERADLNVNDIKINSLSEQQLQQIRAKMNNK